MAYQEVNGARVPVAARYDMRGDGSVGFAVGEYDAMLPLVIDPYLPTVALAYSTHLGGTSDDFGQGIAVDASGNAYVVGSTLSPNFPVTIGAIQTTKGGIADIFVTKVNATGTALVYSTYLSGTGDDGGNGIAVDASGNAYVTGYTQSLDFPVTSGTFQATNGGGGRYDAFVTKLNATGTALVYSTYLGGMNDDFGQGIAMDSSGNAYVTGYTKARTSPLPPSLSSPTLAAIMMPS